MKEFYFSSAKEQSAQRIQAVYRGYSIRKHFLAVRLRFEMIVKNIEGSGVQWKSACLCRPTFEDTGGLVRLKEIESKQQKLRNELEYIEKSIKSRQEELKSNYLRNK